MPPMSGGMITKLEAARDRDECRLRDGDLQRPATRPVTALIEGARNTLFRAEHSPLTARKRWIGGSLTPRGSLRVDAGALRALRKGRSLLPAGVTAASGAFERGDLIAVEDAAGQVIGHGLSAYSADDARIILGHKSSEIESLLGYRGRDEVIHADNLVMLELVMSEKGD